jgi:hypothetical protein
MSVLREIVNWLGEPSSQMFRAESIGDGFDESFRQIGDLEYNLRLLQSGNYYFISDQLCLFRKHVDSRTTANSLVLSTHLEWLLLAAEYRDYLERADITPERYCFNFINSWTRNLEEQLYKDSRFSTEEIESALRGLCESTDLLSSFERKCNGERDQLSEYRAFGAIALMQSVLLENQIRIIAREAACPYEEMAVSDSVLADIRPGLAAALNGLEQTLRARDNEIEALRRALNAMGNSLSWKMTAPLRKFKAQWR